MTAAIVREWRSSDLTGAGLSRAGQVIGDLYRGSGEIVIVRDAVAPGYAAAVIERLQAGIDGLLPHGFRPGANVVSYGRGLADTRWHPYLEQVGGFREGIDRLFAELRPFAAIVEPLLGALAGGLPVAVARSNDGRSLLPFTIRRLSDGGELAAHFDLEPVRSPAYDSLRPMIDSTTILSYFVVLAAPVAGGELVVWKGTKGPGAAAEDRGDSIASDGGVVVVPLDVGDFILFDAGRSRHRVTRVSGPRSRWTIGSFVAFSPAHDEVRYWS